MYQIYMQKQAQNTYPMDWTKIFGLNNLDIDGEKLIVKVHNKSTRSLPTNFRVRRCTKTSTNRFLMFRFDKQASFLSFPIQDNKMVSQ